MGPNELTAHVVVPSWRKFLAQFADPLIYLLIASIVVSLAAWLFEGASGVPVEAVVIALIVLANGVLGFIQERQAERAVDELQAMAAPMSRVVRAGVEVEIDAARIVPGDVLRIAEGDTVTADARLVRTASLTIAEAPLTGESEAVLKDVGTLDAGAPLGDRTNMVFSGTAVTRGRGRAVVTATGMATEIGRIATLLGSTKEEPTPLQREVSYIGRVLGIAVIAIAVVVITAILATSTIDTPNEIVDVLLIGVSLAVAAVPEGLPAILTVILAMGVQRMARQHAIVKKLSSVEALGSASAICSDKTGTLTRNEMSVVRIATCSGEVDVSGTGYEPVGDVTVDGQALGRGALWDEVRAVLGGGSLASDAVVVESNGAWAARGDPTEAALLVAERKLGTNVRRAARFTRRAEIPFTSERKLMSSIEADAGREGEITLMTKGAPDVLLTRCTHERCGLNAIPLTDIRRTQILRTIDEFADDALRTLGIAYRPLATTEPPNADESLERELVFAGIVGMIDPARPEAREAIAEATDAGIRVIMITGDHARTAARIAANLGIGERGQDPSSAETLSGPELDTLDQASLRERARSVSVYARVAPEHKLRIVEALRADGNVVAMSGDGVNDAPALKLADIGVAMGITGTGVAKEAANMILADDNFATIVSAVREGRVIFANVQKFMRYLLSSNTGEVLTMFVGVVCAPILGLQLPGNEFVAPLLATQILWINLVTDSGPALALGFDPAPDDVMHQRPRRLGDRVIDRSMFRTIIVTGIVMAAATLAAIDLGLPGGLLAGTGSIDHGRTMGFTTSVLASLFVAYSSRSPRVSAFHHPLSNIRLAASIVLALLLQILVVSVPLLQTAFGTEALTLQDWIACAALASSVLWVEEMRKLVGRRRRS